MSNNDIVEPRRTKLLSDNDEPMCTTSKTDRLEPIRGIPITETDAPKRMKLRKDMEDPRCTKSSTESVEPKREKLRNEREEPK